MNVVEKFLNELPVIAVALWSILRLVGIEVDNETQLTVLAAVESIGALMLMLLARKSIDGPVTVLKDDH